MKIKKKDSIEEYKIYSFNQNIVLIDTIKKKYLFTFDSEDR